MDNLLKIATWNVNSVRIRVNQITNWLQRNNIDILLMQEIKCLNEQFPEQEFADLGYNCYLHGQKSYNGVAIITKFIADEITTNFENNPCPTEARYIEMSLKMAFGYCKVASVYVPNGGEVDSEKFELKLKFIKALKDSLKKRDFSEKIIIGGDFNVALEAEDVHAPEELKNSTCFTNIERLELHAILNRGLIDIYRFCNPALKEYSWWDYRGGSFKQNKGLRIDYFLTSANCAEFSRGCFIDASVREEEKSSDHAPVILEFNAK